MVSIQHLIKKISYGMCRLMITNAYNLFEYSSMYPFTVLLFRYKFQRLKNIGIKCIKFGNFDQNFQFVDITFRKEKIQQPFSHTDKNEYILSLNTTFSMIKTLASPLDEWKYASTRLYYTEYNTKIKQNFHEKIEGIQFHQRGN